jgi:subtilisin-like proprotein convertase family protein
MSFAVLATAQRQQPDNSPHLLLVPTDAAGTAALARTDPRVLARYESFSLVEARGADEQRLRSAGAERRDDMRRVETAAGEIDPSVERPALAAKNAPDRQETLALVQFVGPPKEAWLDRLRETGARIVTYQAENAYVVHASGAAVDRLAALQGTYPAVRAVSVLTAADKLEDRMSRSGVFAVTTVAGVPGEGARDEAAALGGTAAAAPVTVGSLRTEYRTLSSSEVAELARDTGVVAVEASAEPELFDERAAQIVAGNVTGPPLVQPTEGSYLEWLVDPLRIPDESTFDFAIDVTDEGFDNGADPPAHPDFRERGSVANPDRVAYVADYTSDPDGRDCGGHGTHVASIATGYNSTSDAPTFSDDRGFRHGLGIAPFARVGASKIFRGCSDGGFSLSTTFTDLAANSYAGGARISNNSWGTGNLDNWGDYTPRSREFDRLVRDARPSEAGNQAMVEVFAAGNDGDGGDDSEDEGYGTISAEASAKNVITVGATESVRSIQNPKPECEPPNTGADSARDVIDFSSRGPTDDGRLKPDLVAPGTHITGAAPQHAGYAGFGVCHTLLPGTTFYSMVSGTSQATPQVSGAAALVRHWYRRTQGTDPSPALTKALLINTATDVAGGLNGKGDTTAKGPNSDQGWGRVTLGNALDGTAREFRDQQSIDNFGTSGQSRVFAYTRDPIKPLKVTLAWTDAPGPTTGDPVVNNLDLVVEAGGQTYRGNVFYRGESRVGGTTDRRNNVESVYLPPLPTGSPERFAVKVVGTNITGDGVPGNSDSTDQDFALVVSNAQQQAGSPVLVHDTTTIDDSPAVGGDGDGALEPGESFELDERLRNAGNAPVTGTTGRLSAGGEVTVTADAATWPPSMPAGGTGTNVPSFEAELAPTASCGADLTGITLDLTTEQGPHRVPVTIPTGVEATPVLWEWPNPGSSPPPAPLSIPDDSAAGVASSIEVTAPGRIKDANVQIARLNHNFVGDLRIDIIGPDLTTVTLVEHPGGPDNNDNNLVGTIFDDEASQNIGAGAGPYTGRFRPQHDQLSRFDGKSQVGTWTLRVRDLFEGVVGTLVQWGADLTPAICSVDSTAPNTLIDSGPSDGSSVPTNDATFAVRSVPPGASFQCKLDGAPYAACPSTKVYTDLADGTHIFRVRADDGTKVDPTPARRTWTIDTAAPQAAITSGPSDRVNETSAAFQFISPDTPDAKFECQFDAEDFSECTEPFSRSSLSDGPHTFAVRAIDPVGNVGAPATRTWTVDTAAPAPVISTPANGSITDDATPLVSGTGGTAQGDEGVVTVKVFVGTLAAGLPAQTLFVPRDGASGAWSVETPLADGTYTVRAEQADSAGNVGSSLPATFRVDAPDPTPSPPPGTDPPRPRNDPPPPVAPSLVLVPAEERISDALAGRLIAVAGCASACRVDARLTASPRAARTLGLGTKSTVLGKGTKRLGGAGTAATAVRLNKRARAALRGKATAKVSLRLKVTEGDSTLSLNRTISLRRSAGLRRIATHGLRLWAVCSERCPLSGKLTLSAKDARRIGLRPRGLKRMQVAAGRVTAPAGKATLLTLKARRGAKKAMSNARRLSALLEATAGAEPNPRTPVSRAFTLRR